MDWGVISAVATAVVGVLSLGIMFSQHTKKGQQDLRAEMKDEMKEIKAEVTFWRDRSMKLEDQVTSLLIGNQSLRDENVRLQSRVSELETEVIRLSRG